MCNWGIVLKYLINFLKYISYIIVIIFVFIIGYDILHQCLIYEGIYNRYGQPYEQLVCIYEEAGKSYTFKSHKLIGVSEVKKGDSCKVLLDPENYNNYEVVLTIDFPAER